MVGEFADARRRIPRFPRVVFVHPGPADSVPRGLDRDWPDATVIADPDGTLYRRVGVARGGWREMFGWPAWRAGLRATLQGRRIGRKSGDPWTLPTVLAVVDHRVVWEHRGRHAGDHPDVDAIPAALGVAS